MMQRQVIVTWYTPEEKLPEAEKAAERWAAFMG